MDGGRAGHGCVKDQRSIFPCKEKTGDTGFFLLHCGVCKGVYKVVHFFFAADIVCFVDDCLLLLFGHGGIGVHSRLIDCQRHTEADRNFVEIHNYFSFRKGFSLRRSCLRSRLMRCSCEAASYCITPHPSKIKDFCHLPLKGKALCCVQHIFKEDAVAGGWVIDENMGHRTNQFAVLQYR